jgi:hypothetical protein
MCGGHGIQRLISLVAAQSDESFRGAQADSSFVDVENEVKLMYARGELGIEAFHRLRVMAQARELSIQDLHQFHHGRIYDPDDNLGAKVKVDEFALASTRQLQTQRKHLEAACAETEESIRRLQLEIVALYQEAESVGQNPLISSNARSRAESAEKRIDLIRERLLHLKSNLADVVTQQHLMGA